MQVLVSVKFENNEAKVGNFQFIVRVYNRNRTTFSRVHLVFLLEQNLLKIKKVWENPLIKKLQIFTHYPDDILSPTPLICQIVCKFITSNQNMNYPHTIYQRHQIINVVKLLHKFPMTISTVLRSPIYDYILKVELMEKQ